MSLIVNAAAEAAVDRRANFIKITLDFMKFRTRVNNAFLLFRVMTENLPINSGLRVQRIGLLACLLQNYQWKVFQIRTTITVWWQITPCKL